VVPGAAARASDKVIPERSNRLPQIAGLQRGTTVSNSSDICSELEPNSKSFLAEVFCDGHPKA
jgi:hypothetical protein